MSDRDSNSPAARRSSNSATAAEPRTRRTSDVKDHTGAADGESEDVAAQQGNQRKEIYEACETAMREDLLRQQTRAQQLLSEGEMSEETIRELFGNALRSCLDAAKTMQEADVEAARKQLKAQSNMYLLKLETARTAGSVALTNQQVEMNAVYEKQLEEKVQHLSANEGALLQEAHDRAARLEEKLNGLTISSKSVEEKLLSTSKLLKAAEGSLEKRDKEMARMKSESDEVKAQLSSALEDLKGTRNENQTLGEQVAELVRGYEDAKGKVEGLEAEVLAAGAAGQARIAELEAEQESLIGRLSEAAAEAERASMMHAEECKKLTESLADRLKAEIEKAKKGEREEAQERLDRLLFDLRAMGAVQAELEGEINALGGRLKEEQAAFEEFKAQVNAERETAKKAGKGTAQELMEAKQMIEQV